MGVHSIGPGRNRAGEAAAARAASGVPDGAAAGVAAVPSPENHRKRLWGWRTFNKRFRLDHNAQADGGALDLSSLSRNSVYAHSMISTCSVHIVDQCRAMDESAYMIESLHIPPRTVRTTDSECILKSLIAGLEKYAMGCNIEAFLNFIFTECQVAFLTFILVCDQASANVFLVKIYDRPV